MGISHSWMDFVCHLSSSYWLAQLLLELFLSHLFLLLNFLEICLNTALCEQPSSLAMAFCGFPSLWRVSMTSRHLSSQQSSPRLCSILTQTGRNIWRLRKPLQVFWIIYLIRVWTKSLNIQLFHNILIFWFTLSKARMFIEITL